MAEVKDFLNPNSMLTPGIAGGVTMMIANSLWVNFALDPKYTALIICLLLGLIVLAELQAPIWQKPVYYIINVLVIFSVSAGSNIVGTSASQSAQAGEQKVAVSMSLQHVSSFFINNAMADTHTSKQGKLPAKKPNLKSTKPAVGVKSTRKATASTGLSAKSKKREFFKPWF